MIELPTVTVLIADTKNYGPAAYAIKKTLEQIKPAKVVWLTDIEYFDPAIEVIKIDPIKSKDDYSRIVIKDLIKYFDTSHCLVIQHDGYVIDSSAWDDDFLRYDYVGAPWLYPDPERNVGNGGFSLRSHHLQRVLHDDNDIKIVEPEDEIIGRLYRRYLEYTYKIYFAPEDVAHKFSYELHEPYGKTFGFHGNFHPPYKETIVINRTGAMGDVIQLEPILHYYWMNGFRVVLKTLPQFYSLFASHYFPVESYDTFNKAVPHSYIDLDMAYEAKPKQLHIKSYFETCGINKEGVIRNAKLNYHADQSIKIFKQKYCVIHIDRRAQLHRNIEGIAWWKVTDELKKKGFLIVQIGKNDHVELDAIQMNTIAEPMMAYVIAGCELFIGIDSGPSHVAVATGRKCVIFFGSVNPTCIHADFSNIKVISNHNSHKPFCKIPMCWHESITTTGQECVENEEAPPCSIFDSQKVIDAINQVL